MTHIAFERISAMADAQSDVVAGGVEGKHLKECAECRERLRALRSVLATAHALPREMTPPPEAWEGIRARMARPSRAAQRWYGRPWMAAAAAVIFLAGGALILPFDVDSTNKLKGRSVPAERTPVAIAAVEKHYTATLDELRQALDAQRPALDASVTGVVDKSLADIDAAITETREALLADPANGSLVDILSSHYERKVDLLQRATELVATS